MKNRRFFSLFFVVLLLCSLLCPAALAAEGDEEGREEEEKAKADSERCGEAAEGKPQALCQRRGKWRLPPLACR